MNIRKDIPENLSFPPVPYAHFSIKQLNPHQIDELLANGYFRNGLNVFSGLGRYVLGKWRPCLMLRIPLGNFRWKKRSRKLLRRNARNFEVRIEPLRPRAEMEELWKLFKTEIHDWGNVPKVTEYLLRGLPAANFQTYELGIYHGNRLVAFSIFDKGHKSIASLEAAYHPDFQKFSLGYYTMLLELEYAIANDVDWYYPGFLPKGIAMFKYKLRPGGAEFFNLKKQEWLPWESLAEADWLSEVVEQKLHFLKELLFNLGTPSDILRQFHANIPGHIQKVGDHQVFLEFIKMLDRKNYQRIRVGFDVLSEQYEIFGQEMTTKSSADSASLSHQRLVSTGPFYFIGSSKNAFDVPGIYSSWGNRSGKA
jgi:arginine-tRNA-protein transferase